tara:strand:+ start:8100 stop:9140 length:1041 start_codon:yes stop_codon:yes gene_type:complete
MSTRASICKKLAIHLASSIDTFYKNRQGNNAAFIEGSVGCGKTTLIRSVLSDFDADCIFFRGGENRGKDILQKINSAVLPTGSIISLLQKKPRQIIVWIDDVSAMLATDKPGLSSLVKFIKTRTIDCDANHYIVLSGRTTEDKRTEELSKICEHIIVPTAKRGNLPHCDSVRYIQNRTLASAILSGASRRYISRSCPAADTALTALIWHENVGVAMDNCSLSKKLYLYRHLLKNLCVGDRIDWVALNNKHIIDEGILLAAKCSLPILSEQFAGAVPNPLLFTKTLTKFSTYHNNVHFLVKVSACTGMRHDQVMECTDEVIKKKVDKKTYVRFQRLKAKGLVLSNLS